MFIYFSTISIDCQRQLDLNKSLIRKIPVTERMKYLQSYFFLLTSYTERKRKDVGLPHKSFGKLTLLNFGENPVAFFLFHVCDKYELCNCRKSKHKLVQCFGWQDKMDFLKRDFPFFF